jgi:hypothetical protein
MSLALATRRSRLLAVRDQIDANGGGALHLQGGTMETTPETPASAAPLVIVALASVSFTLHATDAQMALVPAQGFAALSGQITWARYVDGAGNPVSDHTAGPPGSGAQIIVTDGSAVPTAQVYTGGEVNVTHTITEP